MFARRNGAFADAVLARQRTSWRRRRRLWRGVGLVDSDKGRRQFLGTAALLFGAVAASASPAAATPSFPAADDEVAWDDIASQYDIPKGIIQLENGNWGVMARPVRRAYAQQTRRVNRDGSFYSRRLYGDDYAAIRARVAALLGVSPEEIVFTRGATEALQALIGGYSRLSPGDAVLLADLDYDAMQTAMRWLKIRRGADIVELRLPEPATHQGLIDTYARALDANPRIRLMLLTHLSHRTGLVLPVREIIAQAKARGVDVILDSAHAWGQLDFRLPVLGADFVGLNLHKWIGAPLGVGLMYVRRERLSEIEPFMGEVDRDGPTIDARIHTGTVNMAAILAVPAALDFHERIGATAKQARLCYLRSRWTESLRGQRGLDLLTPSDSRLHAGITSFRMTGKTSFAENTALAQRLLDQHGIFTVARGGVAAGACVRVTPAMFTRSKDIDQLSAALRLMLTH